MHCGRTGADESYTADDPQGESGEPRRGGEAIERDTVSSTWCAPPAGCFEVGAGRKEMKGSFSGADTWDLCRPQIVVHCMLYFREIFKNSTYRLIYDDRNCQVPQTARLIYAKRTPSKHAGSTSKLPAPSPERPPPAVSSSSIFPQTMYFPAAKAKPHTRRLRRLTRRTNTAR